MILFFEFIKLYVRHGKKAKSFLLFFKLIFVLKVLLAKNKKRLSLHKFLFRVCSNVFPVLYYLSRSYRRTKYKVPVPISWSRGAHIAAIWIFENLRSRPERSFIDKLIGELFDIYRKKGLTVKRKKQHHLEMFKYKPFLRYLKPKKKRSALMRVIRKIKVKKIKLKRSLLIKKLYGLKIPLRSNWTYKYTRQILSNLQSKGYSGQLGLPDVKFLRKLLINTRTKSLNTLRGLVPAYTPLPGVNKAYYYYGKTFRTKLKPSLFIRYKRGKLQYRFKGRAPLTKKELAKLFASMEARKVLRKHDPRFFLLYKSGIIKRLPNKSFFQQKRLRSVSPQQRQKDSRKPFKPFTYKKKFWKHPRFWRKDLKKFKKAKPVKINQWWLP